MSEGVRLGIVGYGNQGAVYSALIADGQVPSMMVTAVTNVHREGREAALRENPGIRVFGDYVAMLDSGTVDAVVVCVPPYEHPEIAIEALRRNVHTLIEKPAGIYTKQVRALNMFAASRPHLSFGIMLNQRSNPLYQRIKGIVDAGEIGKILRTNWIITTWWRPRVYFDSSPWRATWGGEGGGVLVNQASHQLDLWQWVCGLPTKVFAKVSYGFRRDIAVEDEVTALVDYGDGATGVFVTATHELAGTDRLEILGTHGKILVENSKVATVTRFSKPERELSADMNRQDMQKHTMGQLDTTELYSQEAIEVDSVWGHQHADMLENFAQSILTGAPLLAPGSDGIHGVRLANAIHLSSWLGTEVPLDHNEDTYLHELNERIAAEGRYPQRF